MSPTSIQPSLPEIDHRFARTSFSQGEVVPDLPLPENKLYYPALDGLRAMAVLLVFFEHYVAVSFPILSWGWVGVNFFFVLSGFLITGILYDTRETKHRWRNFYVRRTLRIFPLYYAVLLIALLLTPVFHWIWHPGYLLWPLYLGNYIHFINLPAHMSDLGALDALRSSVYTHPVFTLYFGHFWSLCVEEQFYLIWPLIVFLVKDRASLQRICLSACVACLILRIICIFTVPAAYLNADLLYLATPSRADGLMLGGFLALALRGPNAASVQRLARPIFCSGVIGFALFQILYRLYTHVIYTHSHSSPVLETLGYSLIDIFAASVILLSLTPGGWIYRVFTLRPLRRLGQISYGFYVFHDIPHMAYDRLVAYLLPGIHHRSLYITFIALLGTLTLSYLSFRLFEVPFLRLKDRFTA